MPLPAALRAGTQDLHDRAEAAFVLGRPDVTRAEYAAVLARLAAFYAAAEEALAGWAPALAPLGVDLAARRKVPLLRRDVAALEARPAEGADAPPLLAPPADLAGALGVLYVLEGATLGGQLLRRRLAAALALGPDDGLAFFGAYGAAVGPMWRAFVAALVAFDDATAPADRPAAHAAALSAARATFVAFERAVVAPTARPAAALVPAPAPAAA